MSVSLFLKLLSGAFYPLLEEERFLEILLCLLQIARFLGIAPAQVRRIERVFKNQHKMRGLTVEKAPINLDQIDDNF